MEINKSIPCKSTNYGGSRSASSIKYLVYHYTANRTDTAKNNATYFKNNSVKASAHYFVDETSIYQSVDDLKIAWSVGGSKYSDCASTGGGSQYKIITNTNSISIEMCSKNGVITDATVANAVALGQLLMAKYNIPINNVYRHFDVTGKHCPGWTGWWGKDSSKWNNFKNKLAGSCVTEKTSSNTQSQAAAAPFLVQILIEDLNIRKGPGTSYAIVGQVKKNIKYTIVEVKGSWGLLKSHAGWINISSRYVKKC